MASRPVRLGFIGAGYMGQLAHIHNYRGLDDVELVALADGRTATAELVAREYGIGSVYEDYRTLLADPQIDAVVAILPFAHNARIVGDCLRAGKHVLTEKPQVATSDVGRQLSSLAAERGLVYYVGYMKRADPGVQWARQRIAQWQADGRFGPLLSVRIWCACGNWTWSVGPALDAGDAAPEYGFDAEPKPQWMSDDDWQAHFLWINFYSHQTNLARFLTGSDYQLTTARQRSFEQSTGFFVQCAYERDGAQLYLDLAGEQTAGWDEGFEVKFARARLAARIPAPLARNQATEIHCHELSDQADDIVTCPSFECIDGFAGQARHFIAAVRGDEPPLSPACEAVKEIEFSQSLVRRLQNDE